MFGRAKHAVLVGLLTAALAGGSISADASAAQASTPHRLKVGTALRIGERIVSNDGRHVLAVRASGNVVELRKDRVVWSSRTGTSRSAARGTRLLLRANGALLVQRRGGSVAWQSKPVLRNTVALVLSPNGHFTFTSPKRSVTVEQPKRLVPNDQTPAPTVPAASSPVSAPLGEPASTTSPAPSPATPETTPAPAPTAPPESSAVPLQVDSPIPSTGSSAPPSDSTATSVPDVQATPAPAPADLPSAAQAPAAGVGGFALTTAFVGGGSAVNIRSAPDTGAAIVASRPVNTAISIVCQTVGTRVGTGTYADNRTWDLLGDPNAGNYVHDVLTTTPGGARIALADGGYAAFSPSIPRCTGTSIVPAPANPVTAWAAAQVGKTRAESDDAARFSDWAPGPYGEWSGDCAKFVVAAWRHAGREIAKGNAVDQYNAYKNRVKTGPAPAGALVFYPTVAAPFGHIAISDGNGNVYTTQGMDNANLPIAVKPVGYFGSSAGWVMPFDL